jgi:tight adherence protein G
MKNNKLKQSNDKKTFLKCTAGSVVVAFAIMIPTILVCMLVSINYTQAMRNRARISEATNEASLAIVALNNKNIDDTAIEQNQKMALNYINYFLYEKISSNLANDANLDIEYNEDRKEYYISYKQKVDPLIGNKTGKNDALDDVLNQSMLIGNKTRNYGNTRKYEVSDSFDIVFISDFSGSSTCIYGDMSCNDYQVRNASETRLDYMKDAIASIINEYKNDPNYHFALVPYDIGVPVTTQTSNLAGGDGYACSVMYKMKQPYNNIDYNFWANKNVAYSKWSKLKQNKQIKEYLDYDYFKYFESTVFYYLDYYNYRYYSQIIGPAKGLYNDEALLNGRLCRIRHHTEQIHMGSTRYACGESNPDYPLDSKNKNTIKNQYGKIVQLYDYMFSGNYPDIHYSFANTKTVDVQGTIDSLFSGMDANTITFNRLISPTVADFSPFQGMCQSPLYSNGIMNEKMIKMSNPKRFKIASEKIKDFKLSPHLIPFSDDSDHSINLLNQIKSATWQPGGGTDTMTALLRAVPEIAKGSASNNKIMIIITDGKDDAGADVLRDEFLENNVCQKITEGLTSVANQKNNYIARAAKSASIYYIKLDPNARHLTTDTEYKQVYGKWFTKCMNGNKQFLFDALDYQSLFDAISKILEVETGNFILNRK